MSSILSLSTRYMRICLLLLHHASVYSFSSQPIEVPSCSLSSLAMLCCPVAYNFALKACTRSGDGDPQDLQGPHAGGHDTYRGPTLSGAKVRMRVNHNAWTCSLAIRVTWLPAECSCRLCSLHCAGGWAVYCGPWSTFTSTQYCLL